MVNPCLAAPHASMAFCNASLPIDDRVADAVSRMSLAEKIPNLDTGGAPIPSLGLHGYNWWSEASTGVASGRDTQVRKREKGRRRDEEETKKRRRGEDNETGVCPL